MLTIPIKYTNKPQPIAIFGLVYLVLALWFIPGYITRDANMMMGALLIPYICKVDKTKRSLRYLWPALLMAALALKAPVNTLFFMAMLFAVLLLVENTIGKLSDMLLFLLLLISPVFGHITRLGEFPVRLWLSEKVAAVLTAGGMQVSAAGNQIMLGQYEFSVDPACAGLNMLVVSILIGLFVLAWYQRQLNKTLSFKYLALLCAITVALNIVCNFFRILILVLFKIMPGTFFHDFAGIVCLLLYVIAPLLLGIKPMVNKLGKVNADESESYKAWPAIRYPFLHTGFLAVIIFIAFHLVNADSLVGSSNQLQLAGYQKKQLDGGILKFENKDALIYLKPTAFYAPEHDPMICWKGSGYDFTRIRKDIVAGREMYVATLVKNADRIYAAWWFDNGKTQTVNQFAWRWAAAKNEGQFYLVNVNASSPQQLQEKVAGLLNQNIFKNQFLKIKNHSK